jgi:uncharacterized protein (TIGR03492 family)
MRSSLGQSFATLLRKVMGQRVLFLSNGHGEDLNASLILQAFRKLAPQAEVAALPIVGLGRAYQRLGVPIIGPTQELPSSGFNYIAVGRLLNPLNWQRETNPLNLVRDLLAGLPLLTWQQLKAVRHYSPTCDLLFATGDVVPIFFAYLSKRPFMVFLVSTSGYYEGKTRLPLVAWWWMRSPQCLAIFTRDGYTAKDLQRRGLTKAQFCGYPIMDTLAPEGKLLHLRDDLPTVALLPGSRMPEALANLELQLQVCELVQTRQPTQFVAALVPEVSQSHLQALAIRQGWTFRDNLLQKGDTRVSYHYDAYADILDRCDVALGMAGTAVEQTVGLGKPVVQIIGQGPQFTYTFAEAQMRLLGESVVTIGNRPADAALLAQAADKMVEILTNQDFLDRCRVNGRNRVGAAGGSVALAQQIQDSLSFGP